MTFADDNETIDGIAVIGMVGRFPGASDVDQLWKNLRNGVESTSFFSEADLDPMIDKTLLQQADYIKARGIIDDADKFDASFFGINGAEAAIMDPQQRVFMELAWQALENAGYNPDRYDGLIGMYAGMNNNTYFKNYVSTRPDIIERFGEFQAMLANEKDFLTTRISYRLNLNGPSINIFTACSTSLVAVCHAVNSLLNYQCDMALAGGISITFPQRSGYFHQEGNILSGDGHCRPFDDQSSGTTFSDGAGIVVLKRLEEAIADKDYIYAVIKGSCVNNDGDRKVSFTAPSVNGQAEAIAMAQAQAAIDPRTISYIETHGTGTKLGDPIEIEALNKVFKEHTDDHQFCAIGSIKSNFGHLVHAAGVAGLIKTALALKYKEIPPTINYTSANKEIDFETSPFYVINTLKKWETQGFPRRAGVSSFGVGGTNAHVVLEEAPSVAREIISENNTLKCQLLLISAKTNEALEHATHNLRQYVQNNKDIPLAHVAFTLQHGRKHFSYRRYAVCNEKNAGDSLDTVNKLKSNTALCKIENPSIVFMFPGQGSQYAWMGSELYESEPVYKRAFDTCSGYLKKHIGIDLVSILYGAEDTCFSTEQLRETKYTQPALFAVEYSMALLMMDWGITPSAMIGHSVGEFVAACLAGVFSVEDACYLIAQRSHILQEMPHGSMLTIRQPEAEATKYVSSDISLAAVNSPSLCVVSGDSEKIKQLNSHLESVNIAAKLLNTSHAFHSHMVNPAVEQFETLIKPIKLSKPDKKFVSTVSGTWITDDQAISHRYWAEHMRNTVRFSDGLQTILKNKDQVLVEIGPGSTLTVISNKQIPKDSGNKAISLIGGKNGLQSEMERLLNAVGQLWMHGQSFDWNMLHPEEELYRVPLPTYPFERKRYWVDRPQMNELNIQLYQNITQENETGNDMTRNDDIALIKRDWLTKTTVGLLEEISGETIENENISLTFFELGFDSLFLTQASIALKNKFSIEITFRQLIEEYSCVPDLVDFLMANVSDALMPCDMMPALQHVKMVQPILNNEHIKEYVAMDTYTPAVSKPGPSMGGMNDLFSRQLAIIEKQLELLNNPGPVSGYNQAAQSIPPVNQLVSQAASESVQQIKTPALVKKDKESVDAEPEKRFSGPQLKIKKTSLEFTPKQQAFFNEFSKRYIEKTKGSKQYTVNHRSHLADPRAVSGFSPTFKELVYPIVTKRSKGSRLWDIDDNEYVDMLNGFGSNFFGFSAPFVSEAIKAQIDKGIEIGPQHELAGEVAEMICKVTNFDRVAFCNTGSEAVLGALRIARTVTGKNLAAMFVGAYHGIFNEVINRGKKDHTSVPAAPGITRESVKNMLVFDYGTQESLDALRERASELAAILVEPVQSRAPELQPKEFMLQLREIADQNNIVLIFDEVVTGFRACLGGSQQYFNIKADLATYGKVIGGGWPVGVIAGKTKYMDALDGGAWQYGDASIPEVGVTYFAGTFVRHPPALAAIKAVLTYLKNEGPELYERINTRCSQMVDRMNGHFSMMGAPIQIRHFTSVMKIEFTEEIQYEEMLFLLLREKGIHVWHHRPCFMTIAHTDDDIEFIIKAFIDSIKELQDADFLPNRVSGITNEVLVNKADEGKPPIPGAKLGKDPQGNPAWYINDPERSGKYLQVGNSISQ